MSEPVKKATLLPFSLPIFHPIKWFSGLLERVTRVVFGTILRASCFQLGVYKNPFSYRLMRLYQKAMSDPREETPLDYDRLRLSQSLLIYFGGIEAALYPEDGNLPDHKVVIRCMSFTAKRFFDRIESLGGVKQEVSYQGEMRHVILPKENADPAQYKKLLSSLKKFSLPSIKIDTKEGEKEAILLPYQAKRVDPNAPPVVIDCHSPGRSKDMGRTIAARHLAAGIDFIGWDPRGTIDSLGEPSEGGYYLDMDAVYQHAISLHYAPHQIYILGYCGGAALASWAKQKYHKDGIHFIAENPFNSMRDMIKNQNRLTNYLADTCLPEISSTDPEITRRVQQDGFDLERKFRGLSESRGSFIFLDTDNDRVVPPRSVDRLIEAIGKAGPIFRKTLINPNPKSNGHMLRPLENNGIWKWYADLIV